MASSTIDWSGIGLRFLFALVLVLTTYNPEGYSYWHWIIIKFSSDMLILKILLGIILIVGWSIFIKATANSLGLWGFVLALGFFTALLWLIVDWGIIPRDSVRAVSYMVLLAMAAILTTGLSWSHIRRRLSGQVDVDELDK